jgi:hypothetical protein
LPHALLDRDAALKVPYMKLDDTIQQEQSALGDSPGQAKVAWERPLLVKMGRLEDFVQGLGKGGSKFDMDPGMTRKSSLG